MKKVKKEKKTFSRALLLMAGLSVCLLGFTGVQVFLSQKAPDLNEQDQAMADEEKPIPNTASFTFAGVGDNLIHEAIYYYWDQDHPGRDYLPIYAAMQPVIEAADLAYINMETVSAGESFGLSHYPNFNGPSEFLDAAAAAGFDWFSVSSNHSMDAGADALLYQQNYIRSRLPQVKATGVHESAEDQNTPAVTEINGIKVGLCSFTYGLNGHTLPEDMPWLVDVYDAGNGQINYALMDAMLERLNAASDVQLVSMHWGTEYQNVPEAAQQELARYLHDKGVEAVIGTHPHVIQPVEMLESDGQQTLVYYSLGNFLSAQDSAETMVGALAQFTLEYDFDSRTAHFVQAAATPTITQISPDLHNYSIVTLLEYTDAMAAGQYVSVVKGEDCSVQWVRDYARSVFGAPEGIKISYGE